MVFNGVNGGGGGGVRWQQQRLTAFDGVGDGLRREDERAAQASQHDERMRGWCNERTTRDDGTTTSWHNKTTRGGTTRGQDDERAARREATQQPAGMTRGQEGGTGRNERMRRGNAATSSHDELTRGWCIERTMRGNATTSWRDKMTRGQRNERTARGDATTSWRDKTTQERCNEGTTRGDATISWHNETTPGWCEKRQHNLLVVWLQTESIGEVAAIVIARIKRKPERLCVGDESQHLSNVVQNGLRTLRHHTDMRAKMEHPSVRVSGCPNKLWLAKRPRVLE